MLSGRHLPQSTVPSLLTGASSLPLSTLPAARSSVPPTGSTAGLDVPRLEGIVQGLFFAGLAASTQRTYRTGSNRYLKFARAASLTLFPVSERSLCLFVGHLFEAKLASQTVKLSISCAFFSDRVRARRPKSRFNATSRVRHQGPQKIGYTEKGASLTYHTLYFTETQASVGEDE